jgi:hypothetical protein
MNLTNIALDDLILAFAEALTGANHTIAERYEAGQNRIREKYGKDIAALLFPRKVLRVKRGVITITARPFLKKEPGKDGTANRVYLNLGGLHKNELSFEVLLE